MIFYLSEVGFILKKQWLFYAKSKNFPFSLFPQVPSRTLRAAWAPSLQWDSLERNSQIWLQNWESVTELLPAWNGHSIKVCWTGWVWTWQRQCLVNPQPQSREGLEAEQGPDFSAAHSLSHFSPQLVSYLFVQSRYLQSWTR